MQRFPSKEQDLRLGLALAEDRPDVFAFYPEKKQLMIWEGRQEKEKRIYGKEGLKKKI